VTDNTLAVMEVRKMPETSYGNTTEEVKLVGSWGRN